MAKDPYNFFESLRNRNELSLIRSDSQNDQVPDRNIKKPDIICCIFTLLRKLLSPKVKAGIFVVNNQ